jgi:hypothetical protein
MDPVLVLVSAGIGVVVGLTGMGGGALLTPTLVLAFGVPPLTAVSSDVVASAFMKPAGTWVHIRRGTVNWRLVRLLVYGSVPAACAGVVVIRLVGRADSAPHLVKSAVGVVLIAASAGLLARAYSRLREHAVRRDGRAAPLPLQRPSVTVRPFLTVVVGAVGGLMVGTTSVGSGSLIIIALMGLYPALKASQLVGTDLAQAVPLVIAAAVAHSVLGYVDWGVTTPIVLGSIPGTWVGARLSSRAAGGLVRRALALVLLASGLSMLGVSAVAVSIVLAAAVIGGTMMWGAVRRRHGFAFFVWQERHRREARS